MNYCAPCRRHLNGALVCPGCGTPVAGHPDAPSAAGASADAPEAEAASGTDFFFDADKGARSGRRAGHRPGGDAGRGRRRSGASTPRGHGRRARRGKGRRIAALALVLGSGLAVLTVAELGAPGMPWQEPVSAVSGPPAGTKTADESAGATKRKAVPEDDSPSASAASASTKSARPSSAPPEEDRPAPAPTTVRPTTHAPEPGPTRTRPPQDEKPPRNCFLLWCSGN